MKQIIILKSKLKWITGSLLIISSLLVHYNTWDDIFNVLFTVFWFVDFDVVWHDLSGLSDFSFEGHHDHDFESEHSLFKVDVSDWNVDELLSWLTSWDQVTRWVFLSAGSLSSDFTGNDDSNSDGVLSHYVSNNTVYGHSDWRSS